MRGYNELQSGHILLMKIATFNLRNLFDAGHRDGYDSQLLVTQEFVDKVVSNLSKG